jgi:RNA polymerase primary sigma factor
MDEDDVRMLIRVSGGLVSLDSPSRDGDAEGASITDGLCDEGGTSPVDETLDNVMRGDVECALSGLTADEVRVLRYHYGIGESTQMSFRGLGGFLGMTRERVRQIEKRALKQLSQSPRAKSLRAWLD